jgi:hypothetical protein
MFPRDESFVELLIPGPAVVGVIVAIIKEAQA